jgi:signal transduction histidine kinase
MISSLLSIALIFNIWSRMRYPGTVIWTFGVIIISISFLGFAFQQNFPRWIGIVVTNSGVVLGLTFFHEGVLKFYGKKNNLFWNYLPAVLNVIVFIIFTYIDDNIKVRIVFISFLMAYILGSCTYHILTALPKYNRNQFMLPAFAFGIYSLFSLFRGFASLSMKPVQSVQGTGDMLSATFFMAIFSVTITSLSLLVITKARFENELLEKVSQLKQTNDTKDKLFSIISHDLRGPVGGTVKLLEILSEEKGSISEKEVDEWILTIKESAEQTYSLLNNLLLWAESQRELIAFKPENLSLHDIASESVNLMKQLFIAKKLTVNNSIEESVRIFADAVTVSTIVRNILSNALKFSFPGGSIDISSISEGSMQGISIRDSGKGMSAAVLNSLFEISKTKSTAGTSGETGSGLGLIITGEFVTLNNGKILVESEPGKGTVFKVLFPSSV